MFTQGAAFDGCHRKDEGLFTRMLTVGIEFGQVKGSDTGVEMKLILRQLPWSRQCTLSTNARTL